MTLFDETNAPYSDSNTTTLTEQQPVTETQAEQPERSAQNHDQQDHDQQDHGRPSDAQQNLAQPGEEKPTPASTDDFASALAASCPNGVDVYFDNTGGAISDIVLRHLAVGARVVVCGTASVSSWDPWPNGPRVERHLLVKRARMQGFVIFDYAPRFEEAVARLAQWIRDGRLRYSEDILNGIEHAPGAIAGLYRGENTGKRLVKIR